MDAGVEPTRTYLRRVQNDHPPQREPNNRVSAKKRLALHLSVFPTVQRVYPRKGAPTSEPRLLATSTVHCNSSMMLFPCLLNSAYCEHTLKQQQLVNAYA